MPSDAPTYPPVWGLNHFVLVFQVGGQTEMIATHLRGVHYRLAIACDLCKSFSSMSTQRILDLSSGCKAKHSKECAEQGHEKEKKLHKNKFKS